MEIKMMRAPFLLLPVFASNKIQKNKKLPRRTYRLTCGDVASASGLHWRVQPVRPPSRKSSLALVHHRKHSSASTQPLLFDFANSGTGNRLLLPSWILPTAQVYIVYFGGHYYGKDATTEDFDRATNFHHEFLRYFSESKEKAQQAIVYSFTKHINAFAAYLDEEQVARISKHPDVISVFPNQLKKLHTTRSWDFIGLERNGIVPPDSIWTKANYGKDVIIAHLDTGVWPESASFSEDGMGEIPSN